jgi:hypothetical protein
VLFELTTGSRRPAVALVAPAALVVPAMFVDADQTDW